jgi:hypothetical protein
MRKRLLVAAVFMAAGLAVALPVAGAFLGYVVSIFLDIFLPSGQSTEVEN